MHVMKHPAAWLGGACAVLAGLIAIELVTGQARRDQIDMAAPPAAADATPPGALPEIAAAATAVDGWLQTALARPLMSPTRAPAPHAGGSAVSMISTLPRLAGIMAGTGVAVAIFARSDGGHPAVVQQGGNLGPYRVSRIEPGSVTVIGPAGEQVLHPQFGAHAPATTPATAIDPDDTPPGMQPGAPGGIAGQPNFPGLVRRPGSGFQPNFQPPTLQPQAPPQ